jgi:YD repeat-containing protein
MKTPNTIDLTPSWRGIMPILIATAQPGNAAYAELQRLAKYADETPHLMRELTSILKCALVDLVGIMPDFEPSGERTHPAWKTIQEIEVAIAKAEGETKARLTQHTDARGNEWFRVYDRSGTMVCETRDADRADEAAMEFPEINGCDAE